jgi:diguanylate cyclase (GGDEF)-like protein
LVAIAVILGYVLSRHSYLLFHSLVELGSATVAITVFSIGWQARSFTESRVLVIASVGFLFVGILDILHALAYKGMGVFPTDGADLATQLWIASRYMEALTLLHASLTVFVRRRVSEYKLLLVYGMGCLTLILSIFAFDIFPICYVEGEGLTAFKITSEYIISGLLLAALVTMQAHKEQLPTRTRRLLAASMVVAIFSEMTFTLYVDVYGILNFLGHALKVVSALFVYMALVDGSLRAPYSTVFHGLLRSEMRLRNLFSNLTGGFVVCAVTSDDGGQGPTFVIHDVNPEFTRLTSRERKTLLGSELLEAFPPLSKTPLPAVLSEVVCTERPACFEFYYAPSDRHYEVMAYRSEPGFVAFTLFNITERVRSFEKLREMSYRDRLTGLGNRAYFEEHVARLCDDQTQLPISMIIADLNGLKLINDAFGYTMGDQQLQAIADLLREHGRGGDIVTRWGGDEFVLLLPQTSEREAAEICSAIYAGAAEIRATPFPLSVALGSATRSSMTQDCEQVRRLAEERMYRRKLLDSRSVNSMILSALQSTLQEKSGETEEHCERLGKLAMRLGRSLGLAAPVLDELMLAAALHDIGKIGVDDSILSKAGPLTPEELSQVRRHPEIGYRIVSSIPKVAAVATVILHHHEWWDGTGYPNGLRGDEIPLSSRILTIVDAYDVMTQGRCYKPAIPHTEALDELREMAGVQFDPGLVDLFVALMMPEAAEPTHC